MDGRTPVDRAHPQTTPAGRYRVSAELILLSAVLVGVPISLKYVLAFEMRNLVSLMKSRERELAGLNAKLSALDREYDVVISAAEQVRDRQKWAATRRDRMADELTQAQRLGGVFSRDSRIDFLGIHVDRGADFLPDRIDDLEVVATAEA